jgi:Taurine catabolism dioxygenase TauD, TfdA family/Gamma-butyrobetaine hydroxylase-like, N-terminal
VTLGFPAVWLRHNCPCPDCRDPATGQRLVEITAIPNDVEAAVTAHTADSVPDPRTEDGKVLWRAADLDGPPPAGSGRQGWVTDWDAYLSDDAVRAECLDAVVRYGFAAAVALRDEDPESFSVLTRIPLPFGYIDKETELRAFQPLISLSPRGRIAAIRLNNRSCLVFDNTRILHARTAFSGPADREAAGERHLQGCYADLDGLLSTLAVLRRAPPPA